MTFEDLPDSWTVWTDEDDGRAVLAYRPDVFEGESFPPPCLPTIYVSQRAPTRRKRRRTPSPDDPWHVTFYLEPEVRVRDCDRRCETRTAAVDAAVEVARRFDAGDVAHRDAYQVPREAYLDELDALTGQDVTGDDA